jgi:tricarballylate dehydrogenase
VLEKADEAWSGGNSAFTAGAIRIAHGGLDDVRAVLAEEPLPATDLEPYAEEQFLADMRRVTLGRGDEAMAQVLAGDSRDVLGWLAGHGIRFRLMYERQAYEVDGRHRFWGGLAVGAHAVVLAAGGFESSPRMRAAHLGPKWDVAKVRGTPSNTGEVLEAALRRGAQAYGHWSGCHAIQWDAGAPPTGDLEMTNRFSRQSYPVGIVVNRRGEQFLDEGEDFRNHTYAKFGAEVLAQPEGIAAQVSTRRRRRSCGRSTTRRRGRRASTPTRSASSPTAWGSTAPASCARSPPSTPRSSTPPSIPP